MNVNVRKEAQAVLELAMEAAGEHIRQIGWILLADQEERLESLLRSHMAISVYRMCKEALLDLDVLLPTTPPLVIAQPSPEEIQAQVQATMEALNDLPPEEAMKKMGELLSSSIDAQKPFNEKTIALSVANLEKLKSQFMEAIQNLADQPEADRQSAQIKLGIASELYTTFSAEAELLSTAQCEALMRKIVDLEKSVLERVEIAEIKQGVANQNKVDSDSGVDLVTMLKRTADYFYREFDITIKELHGDMSNVREEARANLDKSIADGNADVETALENMNEAGFSVSMDDLAEFTSDIGTSIVSSFIDMDSPGTKTGFLLGAVLEITLVTKLLQEIEKQFA